MSKYVRVGDADVRPTQIARRSPAADRCRARARAHSIRRRLAARRRSRPRRTPGIAASALDHARRAPAAAIAAWTYLSRGSVSRACTIVDASKPAADARLRARAFDQHAGAAEQHERQGDLRRDQHALKSAPAAALRRAAGTGGVETQPAAATSPARAMTMPTISAADSTAPSAIAATGPVDGGFFHAGDAERAHRHDRARSPDREQHAADGRPWQTAGPFR